MTTVYKTPDRSLHTQRLHTILDLIDIPPAADRKARERYQSFGDHLHRPGSTLAVHDPKVFPQGSFNLGTAIRPLSEDEEYDVDLVVELTQLDKATVTQAKLSEMLGVEVRSYADINNFSSPPEQKARCWRLPYADADLPFHMDAVQAVPEDDEVKAELTARGVLFGWAARAIAVTDRDHPRYTAICRDWTTSNPSGYATWFKLQMEPAIRRQIKKRGGVALASIESIQPYEEKTPLQRSIQLLKRHRNMHFRDDPGQAPISMLLTTLCAHAYEQEEDLAEALTGILSRMKAYIQPAAPRVPNPANPLEDFADRWEDDPTLEDDFYGWLDQAQRDFEQLGRSLGRNGVIELGKDAFGTRIPPDRASEVADHVIPAATTPLIGASSAAPPLKPWGVRCR